MQTTRIDEQNVSHQKEIDLKTAAIKSKEKESSKWQAMYMSTSNVNLEQFQRFQNLLHGSPDKGGPSQS